MSAFEITIPNLDKIQTAFRRYPQIAEPIYQRAIEGTQAVFAKHTRKNDPVPWHTGNLLQSFRHKVSRLRASWGPTARYAPFVEYGTRPHLIRPGARGFLAWNSGSGGRYVTSKSGKQRYQQGESAWTFTSKPVKHPGTKPQPFMGPIAEAAEPEVVALFQEAGQLVLNEIGRQAT